MQLVNGKPSFEMLTGYGDKKTSFNLKLEEFKPHEKYFCQKHGEYKASDEVVFWHEEHCTWRYGCPECAKEIEKQEQEAFKEQCKMQNIAHCKECNIEPEYYTKSLSDFIAKTETQKTAKEAVEKMIEQKHGKIVLLGSNGVGKTMLASISAKMLSGKIYSMYEISAMIRQCYTNKAEKTELEVVNELASIPFLAIDELGRTKGSESELNWLSYILDKRHTRKLPFMLMSNGHLFRNCKVKGGCPMCFENYIGADILSRLQQDTKIIVINAPDERINKNIS